MVFEHHMSDGSAFADFASFIDEGYAREHAKIIVYRRKGETLNLRPVAVDVVNASPGAARHRPGGGFREDRRGL